MVHSSSRWALAIVAAPLLLIGCASQQAPVQPPLASQPTVGQEIGAVANNQIEITFPEGVARLTPEGNRQLDLATRLFRDVNPVSMFAIGYSDRRGDEFSNLVLSARRAQAVKQGLVARGVPADHILLQALGASEPVHDTDPLAAENRRVVVKWRVL